LLIAETSDRPLFFTLWLQSQLYDLYFALLYALRLSSHDLLPKYYLHRFTPPFPNLDSIHKEWQSKINGRLQSSVNLSYFLSFPSSVIGGDDVPPLFFSDTFTHSIHNGSRYREQEVAIGDLLLRD